jgi:hypothetical protein
MTWLAPAIKHVCSLLRGETAHPPDDSA